MVDVSSIKLLIREIEQNIRTSDNSIKTFVDNNDILSRLQHERNHIIFGRRGSGKTLLLNNFLRDYPFTFHAKVNLEHLKSLPLTDAIINTLIDAISQYKDQIISKINLDFFPYFNKHNKLISLINKTLSYLYDLLSESEGSEITSSNTNANKKTINLGVKDLPFAFQGQKENSVSTSKKFFIDKMKSLQTNKSILRSLLNQIAKATHSNKIFLSLDDLYFIRKSDQPYYIDFFHTLSKDSQLIIKIASIKQRTQLNIKSDTFIGVEIGDDIQAIELDYTLDKFDTLEIFLKQILNALILSLKAESLRIEHIIDSEAFKYLCVASGGVPRDFLSYFISLCEIHMRNKCIISVSNVLEVVSNNQNNKLEFFVLDSQGDTETLKECLNLIREQIINIEKTNVFLISNEISFLKPDFEQSIKELVDLRLLHMLSNNLKSKDESEQRYSAYLIDMCLYANIINENFNYVDINLLNVLDSHKLVHRPKLLIC
jgi:hypothetical protein